MLSAAHDEVGVGGGAGFGEGQGTDFNLAESAVCLRSCRSPNPQSIYTETFWVFKGVCWLEVQKRHVSSYL
jgi:hypothetical protein